MKKIIIMMILASCHYSVFAQPNVDGKTIDTASIKTLIKDIKQLQNESQEQRVWINGFSTGVKIQAKAKYEILKQNLTTAIKTFEVLHNNIKAMKTKHSLDKVDGFIKDLNSPQGNALGFKLDDEISKLVRENINPRKQKVASKILENVMSITKSPLVNSIPTISPAVSIANSVMGLIRGASFMSDDIDQKKIDDLEKALGKYTEYYNALNDGNKGIVNNVLNQEQAVDIIQQKLYDQVVYFATTLQLNVRSKNPAEKLSVYLTDFFKSVNEGAVYKLLGQLQGTYTVKNTINYDDLIDKSAYLKDANKHLVDLIDIINEFVVTYDNYINMAEFYYTNVIKSMDIAKANGIASDTIVAAKQAEFLNLKNNAMDAFKILIDLPELLAKKKALQYNVFIQ